MVLAYNVGGFVVGGVAMVFLLGKNEFYKWHRREK